MNGAASSSLVSIESRTWLHFQFTVFTDYSQFQEQSQAPMDGHNSDEKESTADMTVFVQNLLQQMQSRFQTMSESIITKIDEMGTKIDDLEHNIQELRTEMGIEGSPSPSPSKHKSVPKSSGD